MDQKYHTFHFDKYTNGYISLLDGNSKKFKIILRESPNLKISQFLNVGNFFFVVNIFFIIFYFFKDKKFQILKEGEFSIWFYFNCKNV